jgi:hypothetical protein
MAPSQFSKARTSAVSLLLLTCKDKAGFQKSARQRFRRQLLGKLARKSPEPADLTEHLPAVCLFYQRLDAALKFVRKLDIYARARVSLFHNDMLLGNRVGCQSFSTKVSRIGPDNRGVLWTPKVPHSPE